MTQNNNLSVLPFYNNIELQNHRKSYAFGAIYPLFAPANILLPFQIMRNHRNITEIGDPLTPANTYNNYYIDATGLLVETESGYDVATYNVSGKRKIYLQNLNNPNRRFPGALLAVAKDSNDNIVSSLSVEDSNYTGIWEFPATTTYIIVQIKSMGSLGNVLDIITTDSSIQNISLYNKDGGFVMDLTSIMQNAGLQIVPFESLGYDIIVFPATMIMQTNMLDGIHYMTLNDGVQTWYSEMFTIVQDVTPYLKIEWWDVENFVFDAGQIVYQNPTFKNRLYFCTELGKPEYQFDEEGESRDGYYFPTKQISEKTYKCTVLAPEYLCDVMRFIRMADYVRITDKYGREYNVDTFLLTPKWQTQGDLASVEIEFETNTVAKKIGRAIGQIITTQRDYNNDFNTDFK